MKKIKKYILITGICMLSLAGCGDSERKETVQEILDLQKAYVEADGNVSEENRQEYILLGESILALVEIADENSGQLETKEEMEEARKLVEEFQSNLNEMASTSENKETEEAEIENETVEFSVTFQNDSKENYKILSVIDPETGKEVELGTFETGKKLETIVKVSVEKLNFDWYLYNEAGDKVTETCTDLIDAKAGVTIYCMDDGEYTEYY